jgi:uncharacterized protein YjiS (DUF1127 family)
MHGPITATRFSCLWAKFLALMRIIEDAVARPDRALQARRNRLRLEKLPDHMLKDIGISRSEILWVTRHRHTEGSARDRF